MAKRNKNGIRLLSKKRPKQKKEICPMRMRILNRDEWKCVYCKVELRVSDMTLDHVIPKSKQGKDTEENLVTCCERCNNMKGSKDVIKFLKLLKRKKIIE